MEQDLTARARIRDAALELFGARGYRGTSIRDVAQAAGVSPGLVQHHFGRKAGLREACDAQVLQLVGRNAERKMKKRDWDADFISSLYASSDRALRYIARGLAEDWPGARGLFDDAVALYATWFSGNWPEDLPDGSSAALSRAAVMAGMAFGALVLHEHIGRWVGEDPLEPGRSQLLMLTMLDVLARMGDYLSTPEGRSVRAAAADYERRFSPGGKGRGT